MRLRVPRVGVASGATTWNEALTESVAAADSAAATRTAPVSLTESVAGADTAAATRTAGVTLSESVAGADSPAGTRTASISLTESVAGADTAAAAAALAASLAESLTGADALVAALVATVTLGESVAGADAASAGANTWNEARSESVAAGDAYTVAVTTGAAITETIAGADAAAAAGSLVATRAESLSGADSAAGVATQAPALTETAAGGDTATASVAAMISLAEAITGSDGAFPGGQVWNEARAETLTAADSIVVDVKSLRGITTTTRTVSQPVAAAAPATTGNTLIPPPRLTGRPQEDIVTIHGWLGDLYRVFGIEANLTGTQAQQALQIAQLQQTVTTVETTTTELVDINTGDRLAAAESEIDALQAEVAAAEAEILALQASLAALPHDEISLADFCDANGITLSAANIQPALDAVLRAYVPGATPSLAGKTVVLPDGIWLCTAQVSLPSGMRGARLKGHPRSTSIRKTHNLSFFGNLPNRTAARDDLGVRPDGLWMQGFDIGCDYTPAVGKVYGDVDSWTAGPSGELIGGFYANNVTMLDMTLTGLGASGRFIAPAGDYWYGDNITFRAGRKGGGSGGLRVNTGTGHYFRRIYGYSGDDFLQCVININDGLPIGDVTFADCIGFSTNARGMIVGLGEQGQNDEYANYSGEIGTVRFVNCVTRGGTIDAKIDVEAEGQIKAVLIEDCRTLPMSYGIPADPLHKTDGLQLNVVRFWDADPTRPAISLVYVKNYVNETPGRSHVNVNRTRGLGRQYIIRSMVRTLSSVVTVRLNRAHDKVVGDTITVTNAASSSFNGTFVITGVPDSTRMTWAQVGANETATEVSANNCGDLLAPYTTAQQAVADARWCIGRFIAEDCITGPSINWRPRGLEVDLVTPRANNTGTAAGSPDTEAWEIRSIRNARVTGGRITTVAGQKAITCGRIENTGSVILDGGLYIQGIKVAPLYPADPLGAYPAATGYDTVNGVYIDEAASVDFADAVRIDPAAGAPNALAIPIWITGAPRLGASDIIIDANLAAWPNTHPTFISGSTSNYTARRIMYPAGYAPVVDDLAATLTSAGVVSNAITWTTSDRLIRYTSASTAVTIHTITPSPTLAIATNLTLAVTATGGIITLRKYDGTTGNLRIPHDIVIRTNQAVTLAWDPVGSFFTLSNAPREIELRAASTSATAVRLTTDGAAAAALNSFPVALGQVFGLEILVAARQTGGSSGTTGDHATWRVDASMRRQGGVGSVVVNGGGASIAPTTSDAAAAAWRLKVAADTTNGALTIEGTGEANKNISWTATVRYVQAQ